MNEAQTGTARGRPGQWRVLGLLFVLLLLLNASVHAKDEPVAISEFLATKNVSGGMGPYKYKKTDIFARLPGNKFEYIGTSASGPPGGVGFLGDSVQGLRAITMAVSQDERSLVFRHWAAKAPGKSKLEAGIYHYVHGQGLKLLLPLNEIAGLTYTSWEKPFPSDVMPFAYALTYSPKDLLWGLRADGEKFPLALYEASPLAWAAFEGHTADCIALLESGAEIDAVGYWGFTALDLAIIRNHQETAVMLLKLGANPKVGTYPTFQRAVMLGRMDVVQAMLDLGVDVNSVDSRGYTPLHQAVFVGSRQVGDVDRFFPNSETPRSLLERNITAELVRMLLDAGADQNIRDIYGNTPRQVVYQAAPAAVSALLNQ
jgi:hypothetical protein